MKDFIFVFDDNMKNWGSIQMRGYQISSRLNIPIISVTEAINSNIKNKTLICVKPINYKLYKKLSHNNKLIFDILDSIEELENQKTIDFVEDVIVCSDYIGTQIGKYFPKLKNLKTIYCHWDNRYEMKSSLSDKLNIAYFGYPTKIHHYEGIRNDILIMYSNYMRRLHLSNCHYALKPINHIRSLEPLTKISTASAVGANIISWDNHFVELLGIDYPYLVKDNDVSKTIKMVKETFGKDIWEFALNRMSIIKNKTSIDNIIEEYKKIET